MVGYFEDAEPAAFSVHCSVRVGRKGILVCRPPMGKYLDLHEKKEENKIKRERMESRY